MSTISSALSVHPPHRIHMVLVFIAGLVAISFASIFIKMCGAPSLTIAAYRLSIASIFYVLFTKLRLGPVWSTFSWSQRRIALISGIFLAIHFTTWITSLKFTSVASSVVLVQSAPIFVAIGSFLFLGERPSIFTAIGIGIALTGSVIIGIHDFSHDSTSIAGNLLAICGAIGAAGYMIAGRKLRAHIDTLHYVTAVYSVSAVLLLIFTLVSGTALTGYSMRDYMLLVAIAIVPQIIGHTIFNWGLRYVSATSISIILLGEPIGASLLALFILDEMLSPTKVIGGLVIILGVILVLSKEAEKEPLQAHKAHRIH